MRQHFLAGKPRQHQIQEHQIRTFVFEQIERFCARVGAQHSVAVFLQKFCKHVADVNVVVDDGDRSHGVHLR